MITSLLKWKHAALAIIVFACAVQAFGQAPPELKEKQVKALMTGENSGLGVSDAADSRTVKLAKTWTLFVAKKLFKARVKVSEESARVLSDFIYDGANNFVDQNSPDADIAEAEASLRELVATLIRSARKNQQGGGLYAGGSTELTFKSSEQLKVICPLWPFC